jgi:hypothetical protein
MARPSPLGKKVTLGEALEKARQDGHTHKAVQANYALEVEAVEVELGPQVPPLLTPQGRPKKGQLVEAAEVHAFRIKPSIWEDFASKARAAGITPNAAAQLALMDWAKKR